MQQRASSAHPPATERTLKLLRSADLDPWKVERWIAQAKKRIDLFGLFDYVALWQPGKFSPTYTIGIQSTGTDHAKHLKTMHAPATPDWLQGTGSTADPGTTWSTSQESRRTCRVL